MGVFCGIVFTIGFIKQSFLFILELEVNMSLGVILMAVNTRSDITSLNFTYNLEQLSLTDLIKRLPEKAPTYLVFLLIVSSAIKRLMNLKKIF